MAPRMSADEEGRAARKAAYLAMFADTRARHHTRLAAMKQRLPSLAARLRRLWQDVGCARRPAPAKVHSDCGEAIGEGRGAPEAHERLFGTHRRRST
jgi:hypothetical protein